MTFVFVFNIFRKKKETNKNGTRQALKNQSFTAMPLINNNTPTWLSHLMVNEPSWITEYPHEFNQHKGWASHKSRKLIQKLKEIEG